MTKKTTRTRAEAKRLMWEYYRNNKEVLPVWIGNHREEIIHSICNGREVETAFSLSVETSDPSESLREMRSTPNHRLEINAQ